MTPAGEFLADEIRRGGPLTFRRFMEVALYHPKFGYYRKPRDPFGKEGDFFTAEQIQPVFGILMAARVRQLFESTAPLADPTVVELGAGRSEMAEAFGEWHYVPVELDAGSMPEHFEGVVFLNEFFDALPVEVAECRSGKFHERRIGFSGDRFHWETGEPVRDEVEDYLTRYYPLPQEGFAYEAQIDALRWIERMARALTRGCLIAIDYGYTRAEAVRFPRGTLMGYRRHTALDDVLADPGERDITAHVNFTALQDHGERFGLRHEYLETLAKTILRAGEPDQFAAALGAADDREAMRRRMQLKTLLFGMGETFRVWTARKG